MTSEIIVLTYSKSRMAMVTLFPDSHFCQASLIVTHDCMHCRAGDHAELHLDNLMM